MLLPLPAIGAQADYSRLAALEAPGLVWDSGQSMQLSGVPVYVRPFSSMRRPADVAQALSAKTGVFQRILVAQRKILLSGLDDGWHWLAHIESDERGTQGYVSMLGLAVDASDRGPMPAWLPPQADRLFSHHDAPAGTVAQQLYTVPLNATQLSTYLRKQLRAEGWTPEPQLAGLAGHSAWRRGQSRLTLALSPAASGTSLYIQHRE